MRVNCKAVIHILRMHGPEVLFNCIAQRTAVGARRKDITGKLRNRHRRWQ